VDRHLKKVAKSDEFKQQVWHGIDVIKEHPSEIKKYGGIALAVLVLVGGIYFYINHQAAAREEALAQALRVDQGTFGTNTQPGNLHFDTEEEKDKAAEKAFSDLAAKYPGTQEAAIALINLGQAAVDRGDLATGEKDLKNVVDSAPAAYAAQAALGLAQLYDIEGKTADAQKLLENLVKNPSITVSKAEAQLALARIEAKTDPAGACKILQGLQTASNAISKAAVSASGEICAGRAN
jgi:predicted negative regulator of RcsB-dependent stress response